MGVMRYIKSIFIIALSVVTFAACGGETENDEMMKGEDTAVTQPETMNDDSMQDTQSIVALASENQDLSTLTKAFNAADRVQMLKNQGPYTVFAPTNDAFEALPEGTLQNLMKPENQGKLTNILAYHVVAGTMTASDLTDGQTLTTVQGGTLKITKKDGSVMVNGAEVGKADIKASNGVVHVIGKVLMPSN